MSAAVQLRVGIDLCAVDDVTEAIDRFGPRYLDRVYTAHELATCSTDGTPAPERLAARFAAKEATIKALRPAGTGIDLRTIEIATQPGGWAEVRLSGAAATLADEAGIHSLDLSLTHERGIAAAVVVAQAGLITTTSKGEPDVH